MPCINRGSSVRTFSRKLENSTQVLNLYQGVAMCDERLVFPNPHMTEPLMHLHDLF